MRFAMIMFCFSLEQAFQQSPPELSTFMTRTGYQDDQYLVGNVMSLAKIWDPLVNALAACGHSVNFQKTSAYLPCWDSIDTVDMPQDIRCLLSKIICSTKGFRAIGSAAQGRFENFLGPSQLAAAPAQERLQRAIEYSSRAKESIKEARDENSLHVAWLHVSKPLSMALSYDARPLPLEVYNCSLHSREGSAECCQFACGS